MTIKTDFSKNELSAILEKYDLGELVNSKVFASGTVQTNILLQTTKGKFVFRYYRQGRPVESVLFETNLCKYLKDKKYPCPEPFKNIYGKFVGTYDKKPYVMFEFIKGKHIEKPNKNQKRELIRKVAELQIITEGYKPLYKKFRFNYDIESCRVTAKKKAKSINTINSKNKLKWHENELSKLNLPKSLPKGICHCDFHFTNILFHNGNFNALLDFDDANYTFLAFDLICLIEPFSTAFRHNNWHNYKGDSNVLDFREAKETVEEYVKHRPLNNNEKRHLFDLYKLSILFDCIWYFERGNVEDFFEKRKLDYIDTLGRENFYCKLFGDNNE